MKGMVDDLVALVEGQDREKTPGPKGSPVELAGRISTPHLTKDRPTIRATQIGKKVKSLPRERDGRTRKFLPLAKKASFRRTTGKPGNVLSRRSAYIPGLGPLQG